MNLRNIREAKDWFDVLRTGKNVQTAVMILEPGQSSGPNAEAHKQSEQVLLLLEGELTAEIEGEMRTLHQGDVILIPAGVRHRFTNSASSRAITFNTYSPPEY